MASCRSQYAIEQHRQKQILRRAQEAERKMLQRRQKVAGMIESHLIKTDGDWASLPGVLKEITKAYTFEGLFSRRQRDKASFKKDKPIQEKVERDAVGSKVGAFHVAFFALAPGYKGKPHDHQGVHCVSGVLRGPFTEVVFTQDPQGKIIPDNVETREKGSVVADLATGEKFIHRVENDDEKEIAYSVHVYGAPRGTCFNHYYEEESVAASSPSISLR